MNEKIRPQIAGDLGQLGIEISGKSIQAILKNMGFNTIKPTRKSSLTKKMRQEHLAWAITHKD